MAGMPALLSILGQLGDVGGLETLLDRARPGQFDSAQRAAALAALGRLAEPDSKSPTTALVPATNPAGAPGLQLELALMR